MNCQDADERIGGAMGHLDGESVARLPEGEGFVTSQQGYLRDLTRHCAKADLAGGWPVPDVQIDHVALGRCPT